MPEIIMKKVENSLKALIRYIENENYKGYDPYDTLNSIIPFRFLGKWGPILAIQFQKRNPVNIRRFIGVKKDYNPKGMGLMLKAYSILYSQSLEVKYLERADFLFFWLKENYSKGYSGHAWGYNFPWASPVKYLDSFIPSAVVTGFICDGIFEYYKISKNSVAVSILESACLFLDKDLPKVNIRENLSISYTPVMRDVCYNASLLAAEIFAKTSYITENAYYKDLAVKAMNFVIEMQHEDGRWNYSLDMETNKERLQVDFHQGYILNSIYEIAYYTGTLDQKVEQCLRKGLNFYLNKQFFKNGRSIWRFPKIDPVEIHNQAQGIITFCSFKNFEKEFLSFAATISNWTIDNMQSKKGYFYYKVEKYFIHRIPYMRWSQAWMMLALSVYLKATKED